MTAPPFSRQQTSCVIDAYKERAALYRSKLSGDALAESQTALEQLFEIQEALAALGFFDGEADGEFGPLTRAAIRRYQKANGLPQNNFLTIAQSKALLEGQTARSTNAGSGADRCAGDCGEPANRDVRFCVAGPTSARVAPGPKFFSCVDCPLRRLTLGGKRRRQLVRSIGGQASWVSLGEVRSGEFFSYPPAAFPIAVPTPSPTPPRAPVRMAASKLQ